MHFGYGVVVCYGFGYVLVVVGLYVAIATFVVTLHVGYVALLFGYVVICPFVCPRYAFVCLRCYTRDFTTLFYAFVCLLLLVTRYLRWIYVYFTHFVTRLVADAIAVTPLIVRLIDSTVIDLIARALDFDYVWLLRFPLIYVYGAFAFYVDTLRCVGFTFVTLQLITPHPGCGLVGLRFPRTDVPTFSVTFAHAHCQLDCVLRLFTRTQFGAVTVCSWLRTIAVTFTFGYARLLVCLQLRLRLGVTHCCAGYSRLRYVYAVVCGWLRYGLYVVYVVTPTRYPVC